MAKVSSQGAVNLSTLLGVKANVASPAFTGTGGTPADGELTLVNAPTGVTGNPAVYAVISYNGTNYLFPGWAIPAEEGFHIAETPTESVIPEEKSGITNRVLNSLKNLLS